MFSVIEKNFSSKSINEDDMPTFKALFNKQNVILILKDILSNPELLQKIADRSYTHH
jgi:hypothetical protein